MNVDNSMTAGHRQSSFSEQPTLCIYHPLSRKVGQAEIHLSLRPQGSACKALGRISAVLAECSMRARL